MPLRCFFALLLPLLAAGCMTWRSQTSPAPEVVARQQGVGSVRVHRRDGSVIVLQAPELRDDSIVGTGGTPPRRTGVAMAEVERIDARGFSAARTGGFALVYVAAMGIFVVGALAGLMASSGG